MKSGDEIYHIRVHTLAEDGSVSIEKWDPFDIKEVFSLKKATAFLNYLQSYCKKPNEYYELVKLKVVYQEKPLSAQKVLDRIKNLEEGKSVLN